MGDHNIPKLDMGPEYQLNISGKPVLLDYRRFNLLQNIDEHKSITMAAAKMNMPYRSAMNYLKRMEDILESKIVTSQRGGKGGGGHSELTETGKRLVKEYKKIVSVLKMHDEVNEIEGYISGIDTNKKVMFLDFSDKRIILPLKNHYEVGDKILVLISPEDILLTLEPQKSSARNIFAGKITKMELKDQMIRLNLDIGGFELFADITEYAAEDLNLSLAKDIFLAFKAAAVAVIKL